MRGLGEREGKGREREGGGEGGEERRERRMEWEEQKGHEEK